MSGGRPDEDPRERSASDVLPSAEDSLVAGGFWDQEAI